ncbi:MAG: UDP-N-acetylmuramate dehydrogenase [Clostridia bacterium]|nr:UDP-N-acetylmuramate dehydrogenase [Clostridia bacterium]
MYNLISNDSKIYYDEPMKNHTSFKVGGIAKTFIIPASVEEIINVIKTNEKVTVIGNGSNLLVNDDGIEGIVLSISNLLSDAKIEGDVIEAYAGISITRLAKLAQEEGLSGLEWAYGIPGTLGGAVVMNAGAYGGEIKDVLVSSEYIDKDGNIVKIDNEAHEFGYRKSIFNTENSDKIIIKSTLKLKKADKEEVLKLMEENLAKRKAKQPLEYPSAGSTFKRPEGNFAGKLIEDAGLKGFRVGDAMVSEKHAGFVINVGNATANDIKKLIEEVQKKVYENSGIMLEPEVKFL